MAAPKSNKFWMQRATHGRDKIFSKPEIMWAAACEYFEYCEANPWQKSEAIKGGDLAGELIQIPTARPFTLSGLCLFLDIDEQTFENYNTKEQYKDFFGITTRIKRMIYTQKFEGAAVGAFNANIIARDLGLTDKKEVDNKGSIELTEAKVIFK